MSTRRCRRNACRALLDDTTEPYCGDVCQRIDGVMANIPFSASGVARMGRGVCVAEALPWLDARAAS